MREHRYWITISGRLGSVIRGAFDGFKIEFLGDRTVLVADMDQAALHGVLNRIQSLGLELEEVTRLPARRS